MQSAKKGEELQLPSPLHFVILDEVDQILVDRARQTNLLSVPEGDRMSKELGDCVVVALDVAKQVARAHLWVRHASPAAVLWSGSPKQINDGTPLCIRVRCIYMCIRLDSVLMSCRWSRHLHLQLSLRLLL